MCSVHPAVKLEQVHYHIYYTRVEMVSVAKEHIKYP